jgi:phosphoglycerate-specific signal transduction histidine kinase
MGVESITTKTQTTFVTEECCNCGVLFALTNSLRQGLLETHRTFYCPNGHPQSYISKTEAEKLREQLIETQNKLTQTETQLNGALSQISKTKKRIMNGVCPECHRHFVNVERHMHTKHNK